ncbi:6-phosphofructokinase II [Pseudomonas sp. N040]|uniref:6-phosphofructokinase II n=1 Tax=Pseudomonas sp. N040 TaxID=2785325 RepID=UPI0018A29A25|nr:6-phosphofructokinase II [Pseudomonas sp. N040]MBF7730705.1 6-phosphofructokinase II [Pseudomonas sp. N040]MBW7014348.1 6-phosphofructokinase II [Pseudomonas sp. N040]
MPRIVTLTLSPALDSATSIDHLCPDTKLRCSAPSYAPGGGGINVARALHNLGGTALAIFPAGGPTGQHLLELLQAEGVACQAVAIQEWTRQCFNVDEQAHGQQYRFVLPGARLSLAEQAQLLATLQALGHIDYLVLSGSHPEGLAADFLPRLLQQANRQGARCIVDSSGAALQQAVQAGGLFLIKPSLSELSALAGSEISEPEQLAAAARSLIRSGACAAIMVSLGAQGALLATTERVERISAPNVKKVSTVGAGDSLLGAMLLKLAAGASLSEAARYGVAAGSAAIMAPGTSLCRLEDTNRLFAWVQSHAQPPG